MYLYIKLVNVDYNNQYKLMSNAEFLSARQAAASLGISLATLYAYVSRGLIRSESVGKSRARRYRAEDIRGLRARKASARKPAETVERALHFGAPILDSSLTLIAANKLYYRGCDAIAWARTATLEETARLLWQEERDPFTPDLVPEFAPLLRRGWLAVATLPPIDRCLAILPLAATLDLRAWGGDRAAIIDSGVRITRLLAAIVGSQPISGDPVHHILARAWKLDGSGADLLRQALVLCADHELNASAFAVRVVGATGATAYGAMVAGLAALQGPRHGGMTSRVRALFETLREDCADAMLLRARLAARLQAGADVPGFGHPLYPRADPRAAAMLEGLRSIAGQDTEARAFLALAEAGAEVTGRAPTLDVGLVGLERGLRLPPGSALAIFLLGRSVGWLAHLLEQSASPHLIRPRARYTGPVPEDNRGQS